MKCIKNDVEASGSVAKDLPLSLIRIVRAYFVRRIVSLRRFIFRHRSYEPMPSSSSRRAPQMKPMVPESELEGKTPEEQEMLKTMGFCGFDTTKGKKVEGNDVGEVHVILKRKYRQYMNRKGGFNRPLDFVA